MTARKLFLRAALCSLGLSLAGCIVYDQPAPVYGGYAQPAPSPYYNGGYYAPAPAYAYAPAPAYVAPSVSLGFGFWGGGHGHHWH
jgi:hypothetical protein